MGKEAVQEAKPMGKLAKAIAAPYKADRACLLAMRGTIQKAISGWTGWNRRRRSRPFYRPCGNKAKK